MRTERRLLPKRRYGERSAIEEHRSDDSVWVFRLRDLDRDVDDTWLQASVALTRFANADWAIFCDADGF